ncbi:hypothetical protein NMS01_002386 [Vibrio cholerae]|uniref:hypothetical protein n=1 Tax=Vibrio cholerae TaxID=666 RepID=UPI00115BDD28|nr:hypothetical protein [Vibrio cholerae]EJL6407791.1 hypothetical protein [Vibrio cholerae]EJL6708901.1 hypothetical protein [Vibrio cholerae]EKF9876071.1 hypothetical protein [Vibrio cholerae]TQO60993.1 hypothetical protein FLM12_14390 [Vibrio cholerae]
MRKLVFLLAIMICGCSDYNYPHKSYTGVFDILKSNGYECEEISRNKNVCRDNGVGVLEVLGPNKKADSLFFPNEMQMVAIVHLWIDSDGTGGRAIRVIHEIFDLSWSDKLLSIFIMVKMYFFGNDGDIEPFESSNGMCVIVVAKTEYYTVCRI